MIAAASCFAMSVDCFAIGD